ncbi:MAG: protein translocase subunit SecD [Gammaproteobacteria bacterium]|jgi:preprotein translocase subunit SecD|nr:protein translocase subunit SecD [Gammaproteobacteria bacterium]
MNHYPLWKYLLILIVIAGAALYALPNLYPNVPAVQISHESGELNATTLVTLRQALNEKGIEIQGEEQQGNKILLRFTDTETQLRASEVSKDALDGRHVVALNLAPATPGWLRAIGASPMNLGLDLRGGVHFLLQVDMAAAIKKSINSYRESFRGTLKDAKLKRYSVTQTKKQVKVKFRDADSRTAGLEVLKTEYGDELIFTEENNGDSYILSAKISEDMAREIQSLAIQQNIQTLRNRVNELGVAEPVIQQQGAERIVVQLPGVQDTAQAKEILGATATVEFRMVDEQNDPFAAAESGRVPVGSLLYYERDSKNPILLKREVMLTGDRVINATSGFDESGTPAAIITLDGRGASRFSKVTAENIKKLMAVVFIDNKVVIIDKDGKKIRKTIKSEEVISVARIQEQLSKRFQIEGLDSTHEALKLSLLLRAGALAAPVEIVEERTVGPSLGQENIQLGKKSIAIGFILVMIFMALYYRLFGLVANLALTANLVLIIGIMSLIPGATLTLPGIAGIVLTVGMAVDANVLIFERIREELRNGNSPQASIHAGYAKALSTIADANITTLIASLVLFVFGTGPIKGFAVTLSIGILCSMFTAIMGTRAIINLYYGNKKSPTLAV